MNKLMSNKPPSDQAGFIPMMLCILGIIAFVIYLVYARVASAGQ